MLPLAAMRKEHPGASKGRGNGPRFDQEELNRFLAAVVAKADVRELPTGVQIPDELVDEVVLELYGGWTPEARSMVKLVEQQAAAAGGPPLSRRFS
jgi:hypothetical protein